jgi:predicted secreted protein
MRELDEGRCPTTWRLLARARMALGDVEGAREACLAEVDSARYPTLAFLSAPQANSQARELMREACHRHDFACVDLREVFAEHTGSTLPGRRLFLDYCHLTKEGIQVAMAAVAAEVLRLSGMTETEEDWRSLLARLPEPAVTPEVEATARLGAAIHSAHRLLSVGPKQEILEHWCRAALEASPGVESAMLDLLHARCAPGPAVLTAAQQRNLASPYRLLLQHGWRWDHLDADLIEVLLRVLNRPAPTALLENHGVRPEGIDLADPIYLWEPLERFYPEVMDLEDLPKRGTLRSPWPETSFCLIVNRPREVRIELIARLADQEQGEVEPVVNGTALETLYFNEQWRKSDFTVPAALLHSGLNRLTLRWPLPEIEAEPFELAIERLELGTAAELHPVFGEVFSLIAR